MKTPEMSLAAVMAINDQEIEDAKRWMKENGEFSPELVPLMKYCARAFDDPATEVVTSFALIGMRHVYEMIVNEQEQQ